MTFLGSTMSALKSIIRGTSRPTNYQTLPTSDSRDGDVVEARTNDHDQAVYLSFWLFGAGCLLGWNGESLDLWRVRLWGSSDLVEQNQ
jgi:hypothetical protein